MSHMLKRWILHTMSPASKLHERPINLSIFYFVPFEILTHTSLAMEGKKVSGDAFPIVNLH